MAGGEGVVFGGVYEQDDAFVDPAWTVSGYYVFEEKVSDEKSA